MSSEQTRSTLIEQAKAYGVPEALLEHLSITSLQKIVDYELEAKGTKSATKKI